MTLRIGPNKLLQESGFEQTYSDVSPINGCVDITYQRDNIELNFHKVDEHADVEVTFEIETPQTSLFTLTLSKRLMQGINQVINQISFEEGM